MKKIFLQQHLIVETMLKMLDNMSEKNRSIHIFGLVETLLIISWELVRNELRINFISIFAVSFHTAKINSLIFSLILLYVIFIKKC